MIDRIYDAHHHLWDLNAVEYPWLNAKGVTRFFGDPSPIQRDYLVSDFQRDHGSLNIVGSTHIQVGAAPDQHLAEAQWVDSQSDAHVFPTRQVAFCDLSAANTHNQLDQLCALNSVAGIRQIVGRSPEEDRVTGTDALISNNEWWSQIHQLHKRNLSFDLQLIPDQMELVANRLGDDNQTKVAVCHAGSPWYAEGEGFELWKRGIRQLSTRPNTSVKLSGLVMFNHRWTTESLQKYIDVLIENFGPERVMFGSNFPVDGLHTGYEQIVSAYLQCLSACNRTELNKIFHDNAIEFYNVLSDDNDK